MRLAIKVVLLAVLGPWVDGRPGICGEIGMGANQCSSSGCHGGAGDQSRQFVVWSQSDVHSRSFATLTSARAARMAEALMIRDPASSPRCTVCHAPLAGASPEERGTGVEPSEGVSCVSCHNLPGTWLRSHTRADWGHAERVTAGMRDLRDLYTRANTCVACHQNIEPALVAVGRHPALIFELDGQSKDEPKHWRERNPYSGAQAWFVGQAVALRETSWALLNGGADPARSLPVARSLAWVLARSGLDSLGAVPDPAGASPTGLATSVENADVLAKRAAQNWEPRFGMVVLVRLAATQDDFVAPGVSARDQACRAERLVVALDRLVPSIPDSARRLSASSSLDRLFILVQSQEDFSPTLFAQGLADFKNRLGPAP